MSERAERGGVDCQHDQVTEHPKRTREDDLEDALVRAYTIALENAHELKTPLTIMNGVISLIKIKHGKEQADEVELMLGKISNEIRRMSTLIDECISRIGHHVPDDLREKAKALRQR